MVRRTRFSAGRRKRHASGVRSPSQALRVQPNFGIRVQFKPLVQVTLHHLGQYGTNGNWVASNHGLLTGKYAQISIESLHQFDPTNFGYLSSVPDFYFSDVNTNEI